MKNFYYLSFTLLCLLVAVSCSKDSPTDPDNGGNSTTTYQLEVSADPGEAGTVTPASDEYEEGESVELTATPNDDWVFVEWDGDQTGSDNPVSVTMDSDKEISALFTERDYPLTVNTEGEGAVSETVVQEKPTDYEVGTTVELTANPATGWEFVEWNGDVTGTDNPSTITMDEAKEVTAVFEKKSFTLDVTASEGGTVAKDPDQTEYEYEEEVELTATPDEGYAFVEWGGDRSGTDNPATITIDEAKEVTAVFEQLDFYRAANGVTIKCPGMAVGGSFTLDGVEYTRHTSAEIKADPSLASKACTSGITDMSSMFAGDMSVASYFDGDISHWDVSSVTDMARMFEHTETFNQDISHWDVSSVTDMSSMFKYAEAFDQDIGEWDVSSVTDMGGMFATAVNFNQHIEGWDVSSVTNMGSMFEYALAFNQHLSGWDVSSVTNMDYMFYNAGIFDQDLSGWCVTHISTKPSGFDTDAGFEGQTSLHPQWGICPE